MQGTWNKAHKLKAMHIYSWWRGLEWMGMGRAGAELTAHFFPLVCETYCSFNTSMLRVKQGYFGTLKGGPGTPHAGTQPVLATGCHGIWGEVPGRGYSQFGGSYKGKSEVALLWAGEWQENSTREQQPLVPVDTLFMRFLQKLPETKTR